MHPITRLGLAGTLLPVVLAGVAMLEDLLALAIAAGVCGLVLPSLGHLVYRRTLATRGFATRLAGACLAGLFVLAARGAELGGALVFAGIGLLAAPIAFFAGALFDIVDGEAHAASAARSRNV